ncbi:MAG TPA: hypothetical protein IAB01_01840 [Candidatus Avidesulfovibrio excrementigallinarum]|nr:hypothetical protein [Candidatus Avidesulfovibrio excrementigallinarum]
MKSVTALPEFASLTEDDIEQALDQLDGLDDEALANSMDVHPILRELERLIAAYSDRFEELCESSDEFPVDVLSYEPELPIEQAAFDIFSDALHDSLQAEDDEE